jgi:hypothetical protein
MSPRCHSRCLTLAIGRRAFLKTVVRITISTTASVAGVVLQLIDLLLNSIDQVLFHPFGKGGAIAPLLKVIDLFEQLGPRFLELLVPGILFALLPGFSLPLFFPGLFFKMPIGAFAGPSTMRLYSCRRWLSPR